jgi:hypothetical protein
MLVLILGLVILVLLWFSLKKEGFQYHSIYNECRQKCPSNDYNCDRECQNQCDAALCDPPFWGCIGSGVSDSECQQKSDECERKCGII